MSTIGVTELIEHYDGKLPVSMGDHFLASVIMAAAENADYHGGRERAMLESRDEQLQAGLRSSHPQIRQVCQQVLKI